jgi:hypothetical protein
MKLLIEIDLGNDAIQRYSQARALLRDAVGPARRDASPKVGDGSTLNDKNGVRVGSWRVVAE